jgi:2-keto-4-pentenoate hydratase/2-oxohepta-3-ene-1,7-dioic acid hydratase in catechol pathway
MCRNDILKGESKMKLVRFDGGKTGILAGDSVIDVGASGKVSQYLAGDGRGSWQDLIANWDAARDAMAALEASGEGAVPLAGVSLEAPLPRPDGKIIALGANVAAHAANAFKAITGEEFGEDQFYQNKRDGLPPWGFLILADTVVGPGAEVTPEASVQKYDYESEAAVILAGGGRNMSEGDLSVWGLTAWNDLSIRDGRLGIGVPIHTGAFNWALEKNFDTGNACGPWVVVDEDFDINNLQCKTRVNGETRQDWNTSDMIYGFAESVAFISRYTAIQPGDIILSGTGQGTAVESGADGDRWLKPGDRVEIEVEGVGVLENTVGSW